MARLGASQVGGLTGLHLAQVHWNFTGVEDDRSTCDVLNAEGYEFRHGSYTVPDTPAWAFA